jgi:hypothetical protein
MIYIKIPFQINSIRSVNKHLLMTQKLLWETKCKEWSRRDTLTIYWKMELKEMLNISGLRATDFAASSNMIVRSIYFPYKKIHEEMW